MRKTISTFEDAFGINSARRFIVTNLKFNANKVVIGPMKIPTLISINKPSRKELAVVGEFVKFTHS